MKTARYVGLLAVVMVIVFGVTFAMLYLPALRSGGPKKAAPHATLTFADLYTQFPAPEEGAKSAPLPAELEYGTASHDFWFQNNNKQDLPVGLLDQSCQCTSVVLIVAPKDWKEVPDPARREQAAADVAASGTRTDLIEKEGSVVVPAGAVGLVRLTWKTDAESDKQGPKAVRAHLWMGDLTGPSRQFDINTIIVPAIRAATSYSVGPFELTDLPQTVYIFCFSSTRADIPLEVPVVQNRGKEESSPFEVGKPETLNAEQRAQLLADLRQDKKMQPPVRDVLSAYRIPVKLLRRARDGTPMDAGPFRLHLELTAEGADKADTSIVGVIRGDLAPVGTDIGVVDLGQFRRDAHASQLIQLESGVDVKGLQLDRGGTPEFLTVAGVNASSKGDFLPIALEPQLVGDRLTWNLEVQWVPGHSSGMFPPGTAVFVRPVYAKAEGASPCLRIPVLGKPGDE